MLPIGTPDTWTPPTDMSLLATLGIFVGIPIAMFAIIAVLVYAPSWARGSSYRPGLSWWAAPQWFGARPESDGESQQATGDEDEHERARGGVGARW